LQTKINQAFNQDTMTYSNITSEPETFANREFRWERMPFVKRIPSSGSKQNHPCKQDDSTSETTFDSMEQKAVDPLFDLVVSTEGSYRTLNQNEFLLECIIDGKQGMTIAHFYDKESEDSQAVDSILQNLSRRSPSVKFIRVDGTQSPLVSKKLMVTRFPTILVMKDRKVRDRISQFGKSEYFSSADESRVLRKWVASMAA
jgi:hypothetical protein